MSNYDVDHAAGDDDHLAGLGAVEVCGHVVDRQRCGRHRRLIGSDHDATGSLPFTQLQKQANPASDPLAAVVMSAQR